MILLLMPSSLRHAEFQESFLGFKEEPFVPKKQKYGKKNGLHIYEWLLFTLHSYKVI